MRDFRAEISDFFDGLKGRDKFSTERALDEIGRSRRVCVFGIGAISFPIIAALRRYTDIKIDFLCDNDPAKWGRTFHEGIPCVSPADLEKQKDGLAVLITTQHYGEIYEQLKGRGFERLFVVTEYRLLNKEYFHRPDSIDTIKRKAIELLDVLADERSKEILSVLIANWFDFEIDGPGYKGVFSPDQYYPPDVVALGGEESFVDVGAYDGDTLLDFIRRTKGEFASIFAFELARDNFAEMESVVGRLDPFLRKKIKLYNLGLLDEEREIQYETGGSGKQSTFINVISSASDKGRTARMSDVLRGERVTFVKMDIEGAEPQALIGAEDIIREQVPKLAVCVYHRPQHLWEIPLYLKGLVPEYRIFLRHHTVLEYETVCYAVP